MAHENATWTLQVCSDEKVVSVATRKEPVPLTDKRRWRETYHEHVNLPNSVSRTQCHSGVETRYNCSWSMMMLPWSPSRMATDEDSGSATHPLACGNGKTARALQEFAAQNRPGRSQPCVQMGPTQKNSTTSPRLICASRNPSCKQYREALLQAFQPACHRARSTAAKQTPSYCGLNLEALSRKQIFSFYSRRKLFARDGTS